MKGIVFTEFLDLVETTYGYETVDHIIRESKLSNDGAYTAIGTYPHSEMLSLLSNLSLRANVSIGDLLRLYSQHFFAMLSTSYGHFFQQVDGAFNLLEHIENHIHVEVMKLYPDAELPRFESRRPTEHSLEMIYRSPRCMGDFAEGLMKATLEYYGETAVITRENLTADGSIIRFMLEKQPATV